MHRGTIGDFMQSKRFRIVDECKISIPYALKVARNSYYALDPALEGEDIQARLDIYCERFLPSRFHNEPHFHNLAGDFRKDGGR